MIMGAVGFGERLRRVSMTLRHRLRAVRATGKVARGRTTPRCWHWIRAEARPGGCRPTCATTGRRAAATPRRSGTATRRAVRSNIQTWETSAASRRPTPIPGSRPCMRAGPSLEASCWAHARRHFYNLYVANRSSIPAEAIERIGVLYVIEREVRRRCRIERAAVDESARDPLLGELHVWLSATLRTVSAKSPLGVAINYALVRWTAAHSLSRRWAHRDRQQQCGA